MKTVVGEYNISTTHLTLSDHQYANTTIECEKRFKNTKISYNHGKNIKNIIRIP